jgi:hypothetical protein
LGPFVTSVTCRFSWGIAFAVTVAALLAVATGCDASSAGGTMSQSIRASVLVEADPAEPHWVRGFEMPKGTDGYELLEAAVDGELEADWFPEFHSYFVRSIKGIEPQGGEFWGVFVWNDSTGAWEPLPVGADLFSVKQGHVMAWALVDFDPSSPQVPLTKP